MTDKPLTKSMQAVLDTIEMADAGEISGRSIAAWLNKSRDFDGVRESLKALVRRDLITRKIVDNPKYTDQSIQPDYYGAKYSIKANMTKEDSPHCTQEKKHEDSR
jgi:hypothetical protein